MNVAVTKSGGTFEGTNIIVWQFFAVFCTHRLGQVDGNTVINAV